MLLWPIFAALFYPPPTPPHSHTFFEWNSKGCGFIFFIPYFILIFEGLSLHWYSGGDLRSSFINQIRWDKCVRPCLVWRNAPQKMLLSEEQIFPEYLISFIYCFLTCTCYVALLSFISIVILEKHKLFMWVRVTLGVGQSPVIDRQTVCQGRGETQCCSPEVW